MTDVRSPPPRRGIGGLIFDLDGTLVDSGLDFDAMRLEMGLPSGRPILETLADLPARHAEACRAILTRHEWQGAERAELMPGARDFVEKLASLGVRQAVLTRNAREIALFTLRRLGLEFDTLVAREDAPAKPDPTAIERIAAGWRLPPRETVIVGDYLYDIEAGRRAGAGTVAYLAGQPAAKIPWAALADYCLFSFAQAEELLSRLADW